ncbi:hypothetical protein ACFW2V_13835 [Streptomyces sp. NPDC058947]|uniref:hypothetical protein n=1 Tax=Streptomyces sp. NPDC058947 TaxID=3346675 RepID=UPI0036C4BD65
MQRFGLSQFADAFAKKAADTDYSRFAGLRDVTSEDIRAAAEVLWQRITHSGGDPEEFSKRITGMDVVETLKAKVEHYQDDNHLVSVNYEGYWDWTDKLGLSFGLLEQMQRELSRKYLTEKRSEGFDTVDNRYGIWLFRFEG